MISLLDLMFLMFSRYYVCHCINLSGILTHVCLLMASFQPGPRWVWIPIFLRLLFIPFFIFCNFIPNSGIRGIPVLIPSNWIYSIGSIVMAFTSGYFSSLTMMYAPRWVLQGCVLLLEYFKEICYIYGYSSLLILVYVNIIIINDWSCADKISCGAANHYDFSGIIMIFCSSLPPNSENYVSDNVGF